MNRLALVLSLFVIFFLINAPSLSAQGTRDIAITFPRGFYKGEDFDRIAEAAKKKGLLIAIVQAPEKTKEYTAVKQLIQHPGLRSMVKVFYYQHQGGDDLNSALKSAKASMKVSATVVVLAPNGKLVAYANKDMSRAELTTRINGAAYIASWKAGAPKRISAIELSIKRGAYKQANRLLETLVTEDVRIKEMLKLIQSTEPIAKQARKAAAEKTSGPALPTDTKGYFYPDAYSTYKQKIHESALAKVRHIRDKAKDGSLDKALSELKTMQRNTEGLDIAREVESWLIDIDGRIAKRDGRKPMVIKTAGKTANPGAAKVNASTNAKTDAKSGTPEPTPAELQAKREAEAAKAFEAAKQLVEKDLIKGFLDLKDVGRRFRGTEAAAQATELAESFYIDPQKKRILIPALKEMESGKQLKLIQTYVKLKKLDEAKESLRELIKEYPRTKSAQEAEKLLLEVRKLIKKRDN